MVKGAPTPHKNPLLTRGSYNGG